MSTLKHFYIGVKGVIVNPFLKKTLVLRGWDQDKRRFWDIPGGRMEHNETIAETLRRELHEEIPNIQKFEVKGLLHAYRLSRDLNDGLGLMLLFYKVEADIEDIELNAEHDAYRWVDLDDLDQLNTENIYIEDGDLKALELALK